jgi:tRNA-splicing ligase RtcB
MRVVDTERIPIKLWLEDIEEEAMAQARNLANLPFAYRWIAVMPDAHVGYGMPIGGVMATEQVIVPNCVGVDIACGIVAARTDLREISTEALKDIMGRARTLIPLGFNHHPEPQEWLGFDEAPDLPVIQRELASARKQLGTLGGGNHFIELQMGSEGFVWAMIHSGSRNFEIGRAHV